MQLKLIVGDITTLTADAIVNAANERLDPGGGVCGAIHSDPLAGAELRKATKDQFPRGCPTGRAVTTPPYELKTAKFIIHAVGPHVKTKNQPTRLNEVELFSAYISSMLEAEKYAVKSIVFPLLSTGIFNYSLERGFLCAVYSVFSYFVSSPNTSLADVTLVVYSQSLLATLSVFLPSLTMVMNTVEELEGQRKRLIELFALSVSPAVIMRYRSIDIYSFLSKWTNDAERKFIKRKFINTDNFHNSDVYQQASQTEKKRQSMQRLRKDPIYRDEENKKSAQRMSLHRQDSEVRAEENESASKRMSLRRQDSEVRAEENESASKRMSLRRQDSELRAEENKSASKRMAERRHDSEILSAERASNVKRMLVVRQSPSYRASENKARTERKAELTDEQRGSQSLVKRARRRLFGSIIADGSKGNTTSELDEKEKSNTGRRLLLHQAVSGVRSFASRVLWSRPRRARKQNGYKVTAAQLRSRDVLRSERSKALKRLTKHSSSNTAMHAEMILNNQIRSTVNTMCSASTRDHRRAICAIVVNTLVNSRRKISRKEMDSIVLKIQAAYNEGLDCENKIRVRLRREQHFLQKTIEQPNALPCSDELRIGGARLHMKTHETDGPSGDYYPHQKFYVSKGVAPGYRSPLSSRSSSLSSLHSQTSSNVNCDGDRNAQYIDNIREGDHRQEEAVLTQPTGAVPSAPIEEEDCSFTLHNPDNIRNPTYFKLCDSNCILPSCDWPSIVETSMRTLMCEDVSFLMAAISRVDYCEMCARSTQCSSVEECNNVRRLLSALYPHCQNVRTVVRRYSEIKRLCLWLYRWEKALWDGCFNTIEELILLSPVSNLDSTAVVGSDEHHTEAIVLALNKKRLERFKNRKADFEIHPCVCCTVLHTEKQVRRLSRDTAYLAPVLPASGEDELIVCRECCTALRKGNIPALWTGNGMELVPVPEELKCLNWLETLMLRQVRPITTTYLLNSRIGNKGVKHLGFKGTILNMPMNVEHTMNRILKVLPSMENFNIAVNVPSKSMVRKVVKVDMKKVIRGLEWLKANHLLYDDVHILSDGDPFEDLIDAAFQGDPNMENEAVDSMQRPAMTGPFDDNLLTLEEQHVNLAYVDAPAPTDLPSDKLFKIKRQQGEPVNNLEKNLDVMAFPELFPTGQFGMHHVRQLPVSDTKFVRRNFRSSDRRFATNPLYCHFVNNIQDIKTILGSVFIQTKKCASGGDILRSLVDKNPAIDDITSAVWSQLRSHQHYWADKKKELRTMIQYLGPPTFFLTINPAEYDWTELLVYYQSIYPGSPNNISQFCAHDPSIFVRYFSKRVKAFFDEMIIGKNGVLGHMHHYWRRVEYQMRGAPYCHCLLWIKDAPKIGMSTEAEIVKFIDERITCRIPDKNVEPVLSELVEKFQQHRQPCSKTCAVNYRIGNKKVAGCRFGFPHEPSPTTRLIFTNPYNPVLLLAWWGNIDIQFISSVYTKIVDYVTAYVGKGEGKSTFDDINFSMSSCSKEDFYKMGFEYIRTRQMGLPEIMDRNLGQSLHESDLATKFLATNAKNERVRRLALTNELTTEANVTATNLLDDYYPKRSLSLENFCLFNVAMYFNIVSKPSTSKYARSGDDGEMPARVTVGNLLEMDGWNTTDMTSPFYQHPSGLMFQVQGMEKWMITRTGPLLPRLYWPNPTNGPTELEDFCRRVLLVFKPWRLEKELIGGCACYLDALMLFAQQTSTIAQMQIDRVLDAAQDMYDAILEKKKDYEEMQKLREEMGITDSEAVTLQLRTTTEEEVTAGVASLNAKQKEVYDLTMEAVQKTSSERGNSVRTHKPIQLFVSGVGGTGKTHLINTLCNKVTLDYQIVGREREEPAVIVGAPTGFAALAVKGNTLHSLFRLEVENKKMNKYQGLLSNSLSDLKVLFRNCRLLIIDEISMVNNTMLLKICLRLLDISGRSEAFGGFNVVVFGDLLQLPPVRAREVFYQLTPRDIQIFFNTLPIDHNIWKQSFIYRELTQNMRQSEDPTFAALLDRVRLGSPSNEDISALQKRLITVVNKKASILPGTVLPAALMADTALYYLDLRKTDPDVLVIFSTLAQVDEFNNIVMNALCGDVVEILAQDTMNTQRSSNPRNIDVEAGLVNGAMGTLREIVSSYNGNVFALKVKFDYIDDVISIERVNAKYDITNEQTSTRSQFPIIVSFAITIHKCQGMSANNVIANIADSFSCGMCYVALSRARKLSGIHLVDLNPKTMIASAKALEEYVRLRGTVGEVLMCKGNMQPSIAAIYPKPSRNTCRKEQPLADAALAAGVPLSEFNNVAEDAPRKRKLVRRPEDVPVGLPVHDPPPPLRRIRLHNNGSDCFVNSALWLLLHCRMAEDIAAGDDANPLCAAFAEILHSEPFIPQDTVRIRHLFEEFRNPNQHDVGEFLSLFIGSLPLAIRDRMSVDRVLFKKCAVCGVETPYANDQQWLQMPKNLTGRRKMSFKDMMHSMYMESEQLQDCEFCDTNNNHTVRVELDASSCELLVVNLPMINAEGRRTAYEWTGRRNPMSFNGSRWKLTGAAQHSGESLSTGHYVAWLHHDDPAFGWAVHDDSPPDVRVQPHFRKFDQDIRVMLFEKV